MEKKTGKMELFHIITPDTIAAFVASEAAQGASENMIRRLSCAARALYDYLPEDKSITQEQLLQWRCSMEEKGYSSATILNYVKYINKYLKYVGRSDLCFSRGKAKDISGMSFGYLRAIAPTEERDRKDVVWICECKCGNLVKLPATRLLQGNTLSCG